MSWKSIAGNQTVSRANLQNAIDTGVFIQKNGVPGTETNRQITKANAQSYVYTWDLYPPFRDKASNQLPVKSNLAVQSNQVYADPYTQISIGNTNRSWVYVIFTTGGGDNWGSVASATDNRCILAGKRYDSGSGGGGAYVSNDSGETWTFLGSIMTSNDAAMAAAMNSYGDYMIITRQVGSFGSQRAYIYWSYNSGINWATGYHDTIDYNFNGAAMSGSGVYATVLGSDGTSYYVWTSNSFGSTWTKTYLCNGIKQLQGDLVGMSKSGQYQLLTPTRTTSPDAGKCFLSTNYGSTWTYFYLTIPPLIAFDVFYGCSVSAGGDYMTISAASSTGSLSSTFISNDFGSTWTTISGAQIAQAVDSSGQFQYQSGRASIDYGNTWGVGQSAYAISVNSTTYTTPYIYAITDDVEINLWQSVDQGASFQGLTSLGYLEVFVATSGSSNNGKYVATIIDNGNNTSTLYTSSDYGSNWETHLGSSGEMLKVCAVSDNGVYFLAVTYNPSNTTSYIYRSTNSGASFQYTYVSYFGYPVSCDMSGDGKYSTIVFYYSGTNYSSILRSINYSASFIQPSSPLLGQLQNKEVTDVCISNNGRYRMLTTREGTTGDLAGRLFYSNDYGATFGEKYYDTDYGMDFCAMDNSGKVCMAGGYGLSSVRVYYTTNGWDSYSPTPWHPPYPLSPPITLGGLNISSDATYWTIVVNQPQFTPPFSTSYTSTDAGATWTSHIISPASFKRLSK